MSWQYLGTLLWIPLAIYSRLCTRKAKKWREEALEYHRQAHEMYDKANTMITLVHHEIDFAKRGPEL